MTRIFLWVFVLLLSNCTYSLRQYDVYDRGETVEINSKIGEVLDAEERAAYDILPNIEGFKEARFYEIQGGGCEIEITTKDKKVRVVSRDPITVDVLNDYITVHDDPTTSAEDFESKWRILDYDSIGLPITEIEVNHVKKRTFRYICSVGSSVACGFIGYALGVAIFGDGWLFALVGAPIGWMPGRGNMIDQKNAIKMIKRARLPHVEKLDDPAFIQ